MSGQLADAVSTHFAVGYAGATEANPLMRVGIEKFGPAFIYGMKGALVAKTEQDVRSRSGPYRETALVSVGILGWLPALSNLGQLLGD